MQSGNKSCLAQRSASTWPRASSAVARWPGRPVDVANRGRSVGVDDRSRWMDAAVSAAPIWGQRSPLDDHAGGLPPAGLWPSAPEWARFEDAAPGLNTTPNRQWPRSKRAPDRDDRDPDQDGLGSTLEDLDEWPPVAKPCVRLPLRAPGNCCRNDLCTTPMSGSFRGSRMPEEPGPVASFLYPFRAASWRGFRVMRL